MPSEPRNIHREVSRSQARHLELFAIWPDCGDTFLDDCVKRGEPSHVAKLFVHSVSWVEFQQLPGPLVGKKHAATVVDGNDTFRHAGEDGSELFAVVFEQMERGGKPPAHC